MPDMHINGQSKFTPERAEAVLAALRGGMTLPQAANTVGVYKETLAAWRQRHIWFDDAVRRARSLRCITTDDYETVVAGLVTGLTGNAAAERIGVTYTGVVRWAAKNGRGEALEQAMAASKRVRSERHPMKRRQPLTRLERVDAAMTNEVIAAVAARIREAGGAQIAGRGSVDGAVKEILGRLPGGFWEWRKAYPKRSAPITLAVQWVREQAPKAWALSLCTAEAQQAMADAIERGCGWNGIAKSVGTYADKLKGWASPPYFTVTHRAAATTMMARWESKKAVSAGHVRHNARPSQGAV